MMDPARLNLPPPRLFPPRATARIASISRYRPILFESADVILDDATMPAMPANRPQMM